MAQQSMPNPIDLYHEAARATHKIIEGVKPEQLSQPTPCSEWNVSSLVDHLLGGASMFAASLAGEEPQAPPQADSAADAYRTLAIKVVEAAGMPGAMERQAMTPLGEITGQELLFAAFMDTLVHGWDLARATSQDTTLNPQHSEIVYQAYSPMMDQLRQASLFGPAVAVPASASTQDKLIGMMGRHP